MKVLVVEGGRRVSVAEGLERSASLVGILRSAGFEAALAHVETDGELRKSLSGERPDLVFCSASHLPDSEGKPRNSHATLESMGLPFVGSSSEVIELALSKDALKDRWRRTGIPTPDSFVARAGEGHDPGAFARGLSIDAYPYIVKPCREGDSRGISEASIVTSLAALEERVAFVNERYGDALVERFLGFEPDCREYTAALIGSPRSGLILPIGLDFPDGRAIRVVTHEDKSAAKVSASPVREAGLRDRIEGLARAAFVAAGVRDYSRCDLIEAGGQLYAIEINGQPMLPDPWFEACASSAGLGPGAYPVAIALAAVSRLRAEGRDLPAPDARARALFPSGALDALLGATS